MSLKSTRIKGLNQSINASVQELLITLNENYILLLSKLIDENIYDIETLLQKIKQNDEAKIAQN